MMCGKPTVKNVKLCFNTFRRIKLVSYLHIWFCTILWGVLRCTEGLCCVRRWWIRPDFATKRCWDWSCSPHILISIPCHYLSFQPCLSNTESGLCAKVTISSWISNMMHYILFTVLMGTLYKCNDHRTESFNCWLLCAKFLTFQDVSTRKKLFFFLSLNGYLCFFIQFFSIVVTTNFTSLLHASRDIHGLMEYSAILCKFRHTL